MNDEPKHEPAELHWRERLLQQLLLAISPLSAAAALMAVFGTHGRNQLLLWPVLPAALLQGVAALARRWPYRLRVFLLIAPLVLATYLAYALAGFKANGSIVAAATVVLSGLLLGRRSIAPVALLLLLAPVLAAVTMVTGVVRTDEVLDFSVTEVRPWVRTTFVSFSIWAVLGLSVTFVVERIETALRKTQEALAELREANVQRLRAEQERREAEQAVSQAQKMELVGRLAAGAAHDFNNLLGIVAGWNALALDDVASQDDRKQGREAIDSVVTQGKALTRQLLALARQDARVVSRIRLEGAVRAGLLVLRRVLPAGTTLSFAEAESVHVEADETELLQILFNLVLNARDALADGGTIHVSTGLAALDAPLRVIGGSLPPGRWATLRVADSGSGIEPELQERIFELFFTTKPVGLGTGLGLATVLRIAQNSGGGVALTSAPGRGSTFTVYLPCLAEGEDANETNAKSSAGELGDHHR